MDTAGQLLTISRYGLLMIKRFEGVRLKAYRDTNGLWTIGCGHLLPVGQDYHDLEWAQAQVAEQLLADTSGTQASVRRAVKVPLSQPQFDALVSLVFNIGSGHFIGTDATKPSTVLTRLNQKDYYGAAEAFLLWKDKGILLPRRQEERAVFLYGTA
jgi:lysozyme